MQYRVGVIGATGRGGYGHEIDVAFNNIDRARVVAVADADEAGARKAAARTGARAIYRDYVRMLEKERPDIVCICPRWCAERLEMVEAAVAFGVKGIFCEKPMAPTLAHADRIVEACERAGVRMAVAHRRVNGYELYAKKLVDDGVIGEIVTMKGQGKGDARAGAEDFAVLGTHILDSMRFFAGCDAVWTHAHVTQDGRDVTPADVRMGSDGVGLVAGNGLFAYYAFANGIIATYESYPADRPGSRRFGFEIYGTRGILSLKNSPGGELYLYPHGTWLPSAEDGEWKRIFVDAWEKDERGNVRDPKARTRLSNEMIATELLCAIEEDREVTGASSARDARAVLEMIHAAHVSNMRKARVYFPLDVRENPYEVWKAGAFRE